MLALAPEPTVGRIGHPQPVSDHAAAPESAIGWPLLAGPVPTEAPAPVDDEVECWLNLDAHLIRNPEASFLARVHGNALWEAGLHDGDLVVIDRAVPPLAGSVVLVADASGFVLRRLDRDAGGKLTLEPAGCHRSADGARAVQDFEILGVARWVVHRLWPSRDASPEGESLSFRDLSVISSTMR